MFKAKIFVVGLIVSFLALMAAVNPFQDYADMVTDLLADLAPIVLTVIGAALAIAGGILVVRLGFRWVKRFVSGG